MRRRNGLDMLLQRKMLMLLVVVVGMAIALVVALALPRASRAAAPDPVVDRTTRIEGACAFPVLLEETGKQKMIELPGGDFLLIFPGLRGTLTNLEDPDKQLTLLEPGKGRVTPLENGDLSVVATGHNVLVVPGEGIFETIGRVEFILAPPYDVGSELTILKNRGQLSDLCALLE
jgi:hypothetical protein